MGEPPDRIHRGATHQHATAPTSTRVHSRSLCRDQTKKSQTQHCTESKRMKCSPRPASVRMGHRTTASALPPKKDPCTSHPHLRSRARTWATSLTRGPWASQQLTGGGRWNAGDLRQTRLLTCELTMDADALAAKKNGGRAPRNRRSSDGPRFTVWNEGYNVLLFGPSDSRLNISCHTVGVASLRCITIRPNELSEEAAAHHSELTEQISTIGPGCYLSKQGSTIVAGEIAGRTEAAGKVAHRCNPSSHVLIASNSGQLVGGGDERSAEDPPKVVAALPNPPLKGAKHTSKTLSIATLKSFDLIGDFSIREIIVSYRLEEQWPSFLEVNGDLLRAKAVQSANSPRDCRLRNVCSRTDALEPRRHSPFCSRSQEKKTEYC